MDLSRWKIFREVDPLLISNCKLVKFADNQRVGFLVLQNDDVYFVTDKEESDSEVSKVESLCGQGVTDFYGNQWGFAALTKDGSVWIHEDATADVSIWIKCPRILFPGAKIIEASQLANGLMHTLCLTSDGQVFGWGRNTYGQLGSGGSRVVQEERNARKIPSLSGNIVQVAAGDFTSYALDSSGRVWSWGYNGYSSLGYKASSNQMNPKPIKNLCDIKKIAAGSYHVLTLSNTGELYFWGRFNMDTTAMPTPTKINTESLKPVIDIASTVDSEYAVFQTKDKVYLWGVWYKQHISEPIATEFGSMDEAFACAMSPVMLQPIAMKVQSHRVEDAWKSAFDDSSTSDVVFIVENEKLQAHKAFLKLRSKYFRTMFDNDWAECTKCGSPINIEGFSFRIFKAFIYFLYTESLLDLNTPVEDLAELMRAADFYGDEDLRLVCEKKLNIHLTPANACFVYASAVQVNAQNLQDYTVEFMGPVYKQIFKSAEFAKMDSDLKTKMMIHFADLNVFQVSKRRRLN